MVLLIFYFTYQICSAFTQLFKMKNLSLILLIIITNVKCLHSQNYHLKWENDNKALSKLKNETVFKLEFNYDSIEFSLSDLLFE
jgi:hypothetical protein